MSYFVSERLVRHLHPRRLPQLQLLLVRVRPVPHRASNPSTLHPFADRVTHVATDRTPDDRADAPPEPVPDGIALPRAHR